MTNPKTRKRPSSTGRTFAVSLVALSILLAACGSDGESSLETGGTLPPADDSGLPAEPAPSPADESPISGVDGTLIGMANMGGEVVNPAPATIVGFDVAESDPEQITVHFIDGAVGCNTATAQAFGTETQVLLVLDMGITTDAASRTCLADDVETSLTIALTEGTAGREVVIAER